ncbi:MAG: hypothetical protein H7Y06_02785, partial [Opitutaceae bacterium]|nr:hypothetical protein [Opitutaceae bacterium]
MNNDDNFTRNSGDLSPELEARVVAWVLGEASAFEAAQLDVLCAAQPELVVFKRRLEAVHGLLGEAIKPLKTPLLLSPERRAKVLAVIGGDAPTVESVAAAPAKARKQARSWRGWVMPMAACFTMMALLAAVIIPTVGAVKRSSSRPGEVFENQQVEHRIVHFEAAPDRREVVDSSGSGSFALESRSEAKDNRESVGYDQMKASREPAMPTEPAPMVVFNKPQSAPGTTVGGVLASGAAAPVVSGFYSRDEERAVGTGAETGTASVASANWSAPPMPVFGFKSPTLNAPPAPEMKSPQSQALALDADQSALKLDGFAFADAPAGRLESVAGEVRRRKTPGSDLAADPFAAPVSGELGGRAVSADELDQAKLAAQGRSQYLAGDLAGAQETFRTLESVAPENAEANSFLGRISKEQAAVGEPNREKTRAQKPEEVASAWQRPGTYVDAKKTKAEQEAELLAKLDQVIIPQVNFNGV